MRMAGLRMAGQPGQTSSPVRAGEKSIAVNGDRALRRWLRATNRQGPTNPDSGQPRPGSEG
jgi:hypothetical protein